MGRRAAAAALAGAALVASGCGTTGSAGPTEHPRSANVPRVLGQPVAQANTTLTRAGFAVQVAIVRGHPPRNAVVAQDPRAGARSRRGAAVRLSISDGVAR